ncbi:uncharacterized protein LOC144629627 [Oculina patagonica]
MDIERMKRLSESKIKAEDSVKKVRNTLKEYQHGRQDVQEELSEVYKPIVKAQEDVKKTIDDKQDAMLDQLKKNQKAITSGIADLALMQELPHELPSKQSTKLPLDYKLEMMKPNYKSDIDKGFTGEEIQKLIDYELLAPSEVLHGSVTGDLDFDEYNEKIGAKLKDLGRQKGHLSTIKKAKAKNKEAIDELTKEIKLIQKYRNRIQIIPEGKETLGTGYLQPKRNAYKVQNGGQYGNLIIDVPKLMGQLRLLAKKDGKPVIDKLFDFDTIDLLTKRFNSKKKYSDLSKNVFNELNKISEIPVHRSSKKFSKLGSGVVYYNDANDLMDRLQLLGGSIMAGNNAVKDEFSQIAHKMLQLGIIGKKKLNDLLNVYVL